MLYLAVETSSLRGSLGLFEDGRCLDEAFLPEGLVHGREVIATLQRLLGERDLRPSALGGLAVSLGPGSYTGIRVGVTAAKSLAFALRLPLVGVSSHEVLAAGAAWSAEPGPQGVPRFLVPLLDGRCDQFYGALFEDSPVPLVPQPACDSAGVPGGSALPRRRVADQVGDIGEIRNWIEPESWLFGDGADLFLEVLEDDSLRRSLVRGPRDWDIPRARILGLLAWSALEGSRFDVETVHRLVPLYLRPSGPEIRLARRRAAKGEADGGKS